MKTAGKQNEIIKSKIRSMTDWPKKGVIFRDITPILEDKQAFQYLINELAKLIGKKNIDKVVGIDARGFILAAALAYKLKTGLVLVRKKGKLPYKTISQKYDLEYAAEILEMHRDAIKPNERILLVDDVLATGGTMGAVVKMVKKLKGRVVSVIFFVEIKGLGGRRRLTGCPVKSLIAF